MTLSPELEARFEKLLHSYPPGRQRSIRSCVDASMQVYEVCLESPHVLGPRHLVDARSSGLLQTEEARPQDIDIDVMQERRQFALSVPGDGFSYAGLRL